MFNKLAKSISDLASAVRDASSQHGTNAILDRLAQVETHIMSAISDYAVSVNTAFDAIDTALETATGKLTGIADDVTFLKETIDQLQNNPGPISVEDQALLSAAQTRANGLVTKVQGFSTALEAVDDATERPEPPTP